ncbi:protein kinase [Luteitalea sp.]|jgi:tetratricopeptide (TPR) repeat protein/tRNA A-37 threonylcarbamoyl transferase component Bud32|uniref:protein kinase domain-containing protein n=1 Tax=Luteitalea sp. TaxID=2004800 RepID=UPI0037C57A31
MTCPRCGSPADQSAQICPACQAPLATSEADLATTDISIPVSRLGIGRAPDPNPRTTLAAATVSGASRVAASPVPRPTTPIADAPVTPVTPMPAVTAESVTPGPETPATGLEQTQIGGVIAPLTRQATRAQTRTTPTRTMRATAPGRPGASGGQPGDLVGKQLGERYHIIKLLGAGGMGAVYQALDNELGVAVAIKTVRKELAADPETAQLLDRRFKQELLLARKVTHRNIVRVHDIGELDGVKYITMPYLQGEDLATVLKREGRLPVERVLKLARSVISGLAAAHDAGVVHRDLKPANIMVAPDGEGLVMDFGVARSTETASAAAEAMAAAGFTADNGTDPGLTRVAEQTQSGMVVGTIEYMAPEQSRGEAVDQRADIYAFGLILYDLLLGRTRAERVKSAIAELQTRMREAPPALRSVDPAIPVAVEQLVMKCVQPEAADRFATSRQLEAELATLDDHGVPLPLAQRITWKQATAAGLGVAALLGATYWVARGPIVPEKHEPVSILITDLKNETGDQTFDGALEPMLRLALEGAGFISAHDRNGIRRNLGVVPPEVLDEKAGRALAVQQGVGVVLTGAIARDGSGYRVTLKAAESVTGNEIASESDDASNKDGVLGVATDLGNRLRTALGDNTSDSARRFGTEKISATSLDVVREYAQAMQALSNSQFDEARAAFERAIKVDPNFGLAHAGLATTTANMGQPQEAETHIREALRHVDRMTERERFRTRGLMYYLTNDYAACVKEYDGLLAQYEADVAARNNLALCSTKLRQFGRARDEMKRVVEFLPKRSLYRLNASIYSTYAGDFQTGERDALVAQQLGDRWALQALALAKLGQHDFGAASAAYDSLGKSAGAGPSYTVSGLADIALFQGRFDDAARLFEEGAAADIKEEEPERAATKLLGLAYAELSRGRRKEAIAAADRAVSYGSSVQVRFVAGRVYAEAGAQAKASALATGLVDSLQDESVAYGKLLEGVVLLDRGAARAAVRTLKEANEMLDTWIGHFDLGRAYLVAEAYPQADSEFDKCLKRSGEALSLFLDEEPTSGYFPPVYYYLGRAREAMGTSAYGDAYRRYLALRNQAENDPLADDIRIRLKK